MQRDSVESALSKIDRSKPFRQSERMRRFLRFVVERALDGDAEALKEYTVGMEVFDRPADFDPRIDSIVRVEARRLRRKLNEYYEREGQDDFVRITLQEGSYAPTIVSGQPLELPPPAAPDPDAPHIISGDAYQLLLEGRHFANRMTPAHLRRSIECYQRAIHLDPHFAAAYAAVAGSILQLSFFGNISPSVVMTDAGQVIYKALTLMPELDAAHLWRGFLNAALQWNWDEAEVDYQRALELNPSLVQARLYYATTVMNPQGRFAEARAHLGAAALLDPASSMLSAATGMTEYFSGDFEAAMDHYRRAIELNPGFHGVRRLLAYALLASGQGEEALRALELAEPVVEGDARLLAAQGYVLGRLGKYEQASMILETLETLSVESYVSAYDRALVHLGLGQYDVACRLLVEASGEHEPWLIMLNVDPIFEPLRGLAAFQELVRRVLPPER
ncbi:tetratricopeptide repeat protein [uncultured Paludibaculum sp.]|uniref:tetratricopeptide repeat protein n=1 Tax=uncultured Paludibaculum sp. TaxID=1765020 RepID=UPI002AAB6276|nr:tetratricopeptide repeat protein [uncultured Paludibaculum sp.]